MKNFSACAITGAIIIILMGLIALSTQGVRAASDKDPGQYLIVAPPPPPLAIYYLPAFSVTTTDAEPHFAKITMSFGYEVNVKLKAELERRTAEIQHIIHILLSGKKYQEINSVEDSIALAEEIKARINMILTSGMVKEVYFKEFLIN